MMMKRFIGWLAILLVCMLVSGCETMSKDECRFANWSDIGMRDGLAGEPLSLFGERVKDCTKAGIRVDDNLYMANRDRGLQNFCRLENAAPLGLSGRSYAGVCPAQIDYEFRRRYQTGYAVHDLRGKVNEFDGRSDRLQRKLREADRDEDKQLKVADKEDDRKRIRKEYDERRRQIRHELGDLDRALRRTRDALRDAEYTLDNLR
jgi:hypothetical protein